MDLESFLVATPPPSFRREPCRVLFPLGAGLAAVAVLPFAAGGAGGSSLALFHSVAQIQGFLTCFLVGVLFTVVPRQTGTTAPAPWQLAAAILLPVLSVALAFDGSQTLAHLAWLALAVIAVEFAARRLAGARGRHALEPVLLWVPMSLAAGAGGAALIAASSWLDLHSGLKAWAIGRGLLVQGLVAGFVVAAGGALVQRSRHPRPASAAQAGAHRRRALAWHAALALAFFSSFPIEVLVSVRIGFALRALVPLAVLVWAARIRPAPVIAGLQGWLAWAGAWLVPLGFVMGALFPRLRGAALHVVFVGGFAQLALVLSSHLLLPFEDGSAGPPNRWALRGMAALLAIAFAGRILAGIDFGHVPLWLSIAALAFLAALAAWGVVIGPALRQARFTSRR